MPIEEIMVALDQINFEEFSDKRLSELAEYFRTKSTEARRVAYFRARQRSQIDPDVMAAD